MSFSNSYKHTIDSKKRLFIPAKFRAKLGDSFYLYYDESLPCIAVYGEEEWEKKSKIVEESGDADWQRFFFSNVVSVEPDINDANLDIFSSGPKFLSMLSSNAIEPLPDIGFSIASGIISGGIFMRFAIGHKKLEITSNVPEAFNIVTAVISPIKDGAIENAEFIPSEAPFKNSSNIGTFLNRPVNIIIANTIGII